MPPNHSLYDAFPTASRVRMIELQHPWILLLLPLPIVAWWLLPALAANAVLPVPQSVRRLMVRLSGENRRRRRGLPDDMWLKLFGWLALIIALSGPQSREAVLVNPTGRDLMVAIDLSASMDEKDMDLEGAVVARYLVVRDMLGAFIRERKGDRVGLITFGHEAYLIAPLSFDTEAVAELLGQLAIGLPGHRTDLGRAVGLTIQNFKTQKEANRVLILLSDGEDNTGELTGLDAADLAAAHDIRIHTIGFSTEIDTDGAEILKKIARETGGVFFWAKSAKGLAEVSQRIDALESSSQEEDEDFVVRNWAAIAIGLALTALAALVIQEMRQA